MKPQEAIEELKYSIEPNQGFMECRTGTIKEEAIKIAVEALEKQAADLTVIYFRMYYLRYGKMENALNGIIARSLLGK